MRCEIPILLRCCFCFPLRHGLLVWAYLKQVLSLAFAVMIIVQMSFIRRRLYTMDYVMFSAIIVFLVVDIIFHVLFIISAHKKDYRKMRVFYRYSLVILCLSGGMFLFQIGVTIYSAVELPPFLVTYYLLVYFLPMLALSLIFIIFEAYLLLLVRSEFIKLKNNSQFEFVNQRPDEQCTANLDFATGLPYIA